MPYITKKIPIRPKKKPRRIKKPDPKKVKPEVDEKERIKLKNVKTKLLKKKQLDDNSN